MQTSFKYQDTLGVGHPRTAHVMYSWYPLGGLWTFRGTKIDGGLSKQTFDENIPFEVTWTWAEK